MAIHLEKIPALLIGLTVLIVILLFLFNFNYVRNFIVNSDIGNLLSLQDEKSIEQSNNLFTDLNNKMNSCVKSTNTGCKCLDNNFLLPNGYYINLDNKQDNIAKSLVFTMYSNTNLKLKEFNLVDATGCYSVNAKTEDLQANEANPLKILFGKDNKFTYKRKSYAFSPELIFYKVSSNKICVIDKSSADKLKQSPVC